MLRFEEQEVHGPGIDVFDIAIESQTVLDISMCMDRVGRYYALDRRFAITITDGELNVITGPQLSARPPSLPWN